ncbi:MAG TPA: PadR family transcriptional regulator [Saprospiraceae bacterium]|nr:PadR family transcriptional regulator [Saprospiraceae bacterium]HRO72758.1 PadR family transcriptional regulator [Saprospiraceae bacterium]HRP42660.1 PadR family transcriptional regulator [Saprospiraceae bacterium]
MEIKLENTKAQMRKGILELCVLSIIADDEAYPTDIINKLKESELIVVEGTLYPLLNRLKDSGLLDYYWKESRQGPPRKYYKVTPQGSTFLEGLYATWNDLNNSVNQLYNLKTNSKNEQNI